MNHLGPTAIIVVALAISQSLSAQPKLPVLSFSMTDAAWKDTLTNLEAIVFESASGEPLHRSGAERRHDAVAVRGRRTEQIAVSVVWQAGIESGHPSPFQSPTATKEVMPVAPKSITTVSPERPAQSRRDRARALNLTYAQKLALVEAWQAGYHVGLPLAFTAIVYVESSGCKHVHGDNGLAFGCSQVHEAAAYAATGVHIPPWILSDPDLRALNMAVGAKYLQLCIGRFGWPAGVACYNQGLHTRLSHRSLLHLRYTRRVLAAMKWLKNLPRSEE